VVNNPQLEFGNQPARSRPAPVELVQELEDILVSILVPLTEKERTQVCFDLLNTPGKLCLVDNPLRLIDKEKSPLNSRVIKVGRNSFNHTLIAALQKACLSKHNKVS
jgi:hypothetical protein